MSQPLSKRFACDRCRDQKLRCPREENSSDPCARCLRAGAVCVTGCSRLIGRPPRATTTNTNTTTTTNTSPSAVTASTTSTLSPATSRSVSTRRRRDPRTNSRLAMLHNRALPSGSTAGQKPFQQSSVSDDAFCLPLIQDQPIWLKPSSNNLAQGDFLQTTATTTLDGIPSLLTLEAQAPSAAALQSSASARDPFHDLHTTAQFLSQDLDQRPDFADSQLPELPDGCDAVLWLANLNTSISSQLAQVCTRPCTGPSDSHASIFGPLYGVGVESSPDDPNPLGELLRCTSHFLNILRALDATYPPSSSSSSASLSSPGVEPLELMAGGLPNGRLSSSSMSGLQQQPHWTSSSSSSAPPSPSSSRPLPFNPPTILMIITTYLQLVRLYDAAVARMHASLLEMREGEVASFQALPGLRLGGFPLSHGNLHIKIILQVLEHQLDLIERLMGLPAEYRLSTQQETAEGIFRNSEELLVLLQAVMGQSAGSCHSMGLHYVVSLKENLQKVKLLLQG